jgi:hypothetical protein
MSGKISSCRWVRQTLTVCLEVRQISRTVTNETRSISSPLVTSGEAQDSVIQSESQQLL